MTTATAAAVAPRVDAPELLDIHAASAWLGFSTTKLRRLLDDPGEEMPATVRIGKRNYLRRRDLEAWLSAKGTAHAAAA